MEASKNANKAKRWFASSVIAIDGYEPFGDNLPNYKASGKRLTEAVTIGKGRRTKTSVIGEETCAKRVSKPYLRYLLFGIAVTIMAPMSVRHSDVRTFDALLAGTIQ